LTLHNTQCTQLLCSPTTSQFYFALSPTRVLTTASHFLIPVFRSGSQRPKLRIILLSGTLFSTHRRIPAKVELPGWPVAPSYGQSTSLPSLMLRPLGVNPATTLRWSPRRRRRSRYTPYPLQGHIPTKLHQFLIGSFRYFVRTDAQTDRETPPKTIPARSIAGAQVTMSLIAACGRKKVFKCCRNVAIAKDGLVWVEFHCTVVGHLQRNFFCRSRVSLEIDRNTTVQGLQFQDTRNGICRPAYLNELKCCQPPLAW